MPDPDLHGNHDPCPQCSLRREALGGVLIGKGQVACNWCGGAGWLPLSAVEITARTAAEARVSYWPEFERRIAR